MPRKRPKLTPAELRGAHAAFCWFTDRIGERTGDQEKAVQGVWKMFKRFRRELPANWRELVREGN